MRSDNGVDTQGTEGVDSRKIQKRRAKVSRKRECFDDWIRRDKGGFGLSFTGNSFAWVVLPNGRAGFAIARRQNMLHGFRLREEH
jgi:hypothetical protein